MCVCVEEQQPKGLIRERTGENEAKRANEIKTSTRFLGRSGVGERRVIVRSGGNISRDVSRGGSCFQKARWV